MRLSLLAALILILTPPFASAASPALDRYLDKLRPRADGLQAFFGKITDVNRGAKTITLRLGSNLVFHITDSTKISDPSGPVSLDQIRLGEGAEIVMRPGKGGNRIAITIKLDHKATFPDEPAVRTVRGETIMGPMAMEFVVYHPPTSQFQRTVDFGNRLGTFILSVRPDGTVASVKALKSLGYRELDERAEAWLMLWKFRPHSVTEVQLPMSYTRMQRY